MLLDAGEGAAAIQPVTYAAQDPASRALQAFSVDISGNPDRSVLLNQIRGTSVTVGTGEGEALTGVIVGVENQNIFRGDELTTQFTLNLLADDGLHSVSLSDVRRIKINDVKLNEELRQALAAVAQGRDANKRPLTLTFSGQGRRRVLVGYIAEAPAWQTTYRLVLGDAPLLQGWALVQNTGQDDWDDAQLSLVSGRPISFIQDLYTPLYVHRPRVQPRIPAAPTPQTYESDLMAEFVMERGMAGAAYMLAEDDMPSAPAAHLARRTPASEVRRGLSSAKLAVVEAAQQSVATSGAELGAALFAYHIDVPVSIPRQPVRHDPVHGLRSAGRARLRLQRSGAEASPAVRGPAEEHDGTAFDGRAADGLRRGRRRPWLRRRRADGRHRAGPARLLTLPWTWPWMPRPRRRRRPGWPPQ